MPKPDDYTGPVIEVDADGEITVHILPPLVFQQLRLFTLPPTTSEW